MGFLLLIAWLAAVLAGVFAGIMIYPLVLLASTLVAVGHYLVQAWTVLVPGSSPVAPPRDDEERDPAHPHYLSGQVWKDWTTILRAVVPRVKAQADRALRGATGTLAGGDQRWFLFPIWLAVCGGIVSAVVPAGVIAALIMAVYAVTTALGLLVWLLCVGVLRVLDHVFVLAYRILQTCPYPRCYARFTLPVYACPECGAAHANLRPDLNGAARHVCRCGVRLPTTVLLGRYRLQAHCPACDRLLPDRVGRVRIEPLPFVGGPDAGKTTFMALGVEAVHEAVHAAGGRAFFADRSDDQAFRQLRRELAAGRISKTLPDLPKAVILDVALPGKGKSGGNRILYLFDPSGEHYTGASKVEEMRYLAHGEALILVIDPFAIPEVQDHLLESERRTLLEEGVVLSREDPADTFARLRNELVSRADGGRQRRVAVVLSKADLLRQTTSGRGADDLPSWLRTMGLGNLVRELDHQKADVRYLTSGIPPEGTRIAELLAWAGGLRLNGRLAGETATAVSELTTGEARRPWEPRPRAAGRPPTSYLIFRRALAAAMTVISAVMLVLLVLVLLKVWLPEG
ncbi:hypothetical protein SAMN05444920_115122 [Nonomuraea solani]|uniref:Double-GTPase 2 domain-containing protein n=1 Tax=Nonomuraea solani TaxID=1144553 RepID=A0A1H6ERW0_9ACTN|nr:hypothetical protein [Nonomuraea solani]SEH00143.1 hypothetical protein SAMN05444920_115122 [Nonomuraea solani]